jgi:uroporphyrinogen-III decarboxylase
VYAGPKHDLAEGVTYQSIFGIDRSGLGYGQPLSHPLAVASLKEIHDYPWPDPVWMDVSKIKEQALAWHGQYAILGGEWCPFWHDAIDLLGMENLYIKMYSEPEVVHAVMEHIVDFYFEASKRMFDTAGNVIDIFFIGNDFGGQNGPLMGPELFRTFIYPHLQKLADLGHSYGLKVQMHCCGGIFELIPLMIEAGIDALHSLQPDCGGMDLRKIKAEFGDKIVLNGGIDSKRILIDGTVDFVKEKTGDILDIMMPGGGYIAGASHDSILEETPVDNVVAMFDTIDMYGIYHQ